MTNSEQPKPKPLRSSYSEQHLLGGREYVQSHSTNIAETFKRIRERQKAEEQRKQGEDK